MTEGQQLTVVMVCAANHCRSRLAEAALQFALNDLEHINVQSAGTEVLDEVPMCPDAATHLRARSIDADIERHGIQLTAPMLTTADLLFAADAAVRSASVAMNPEARPKLFSMRHAGMAAQFLLDEDLVSRARNAHTLGQMHVEETYGNETVKLAAALAPGISAAATWLQLELAAAQAMVSATGNQDIGDAHTIRSQRHRDTFAQVEQAVTPLATLLRTVLNGA